MAKPDSKVEEQEATRPQMDEVLMERLRKVATALEDESPSGPMTGPAFLELKDEPRKTPESWEQVEGRGKTSRNAGHVVALLVANAYVDAYLLECPGTSRDHAVILVQGLLDAQREHGMRKCNAADDPGGEGAEAWDAAMAAILYTAFVAGPAPIREESATWWRQVMESESVLPGDVYAWVQYGKRSRNATLAAEFFYHMENVALPKPARPWKVVA